MKLNLSEFYNDPFSWVDSKEIMFFGNNLNLFHKYQRLAGTAYFLALLGLGAWALFGFDSTPLQFLHVLYDGIPGYLAGQLSFNELIAIYHNFYGKEMHYSAFVIYGLEYWYLSTHFKDLGITKSKNVVYSCVITFLSIAVFEWFWILNFGFWQSQPWVYTWAWPQMRILLQNVAFSIVGAMGLLFIWVDSYEYLKGQVTGRRLFHFRLDLKAWILILLTVISLSVWVFYPGHVERISVELSTGQIWTNSARFPQTLYTVDIQPLDNVNAGTWFYVENDLVHGLNTVAKAIMTLAFCYVGCVRRAKDRRGKDPDPYDLPVHTCRVIHRGQTIY